MWQNGCPVKETFFTDNNIATPINNIRNWKQVKSFIKLCKCTHGCSVQFVKRTSFQNMPWPHSTYCLINFLEYNLINISVYFSFSNFRYFRLVPEAWLEHLTLCGHFPVEYCTKRGTNPISNNCVIDGWLSQVVKTQRMSWFDFVCHSAGSTQ